MSRPALVFLLAACGDTVVREDAGRTSDGGADAASVCGIPGATRMAPCGNCGQMIETCSPTGWTAGSCMSEGECAAGTTETEDLAMCAQRSRTCTAECTWTEWADSRPPGECAPADTTLSRDGCEPNLYRNVTCTEACTWEAGECQDLCPGDALPDEICIPAGRFYRGDEAYEDATPVEVVEISRPFYIMRRPYTLGAWIADYEAGRIPAGVPSHVSVDFFTLYEERLDSPTAGIPPWYGEIICSMTRGGRLPTEAEWEYAARGPAPNMNAYVWGEDATRCDIRSMAGCPDYVPPGIYPGDYNVPFAVDSLPATASWFGAELMAMGVYESVADVYHSEYYAELKSTADPLLTREDCMMLRPGSGECLEFSFRGAPLHGPPDERRIAFRGHYEYPGEMDALTLVYKQLGLRCARNAE